MTKSELEIGLRLLKKYFGPAITRAIEIAGMENLPLDKQFRMQLDLVKMFIEMKKADIQLKNAQTTGNVDSDDDAAPPEQKPIFKLV